MPSCISAFPTDSFSHRGTRIPGGVDMEAGVIGDAGARHRLAWCDVDVKD